MYVFIAPSSERLRRAVRPTVLGRSPHCRRRTTDVLRPSRSHFPHSYHSTVMREIAASLLTLSDDAIVVGLIRAKRSGHAIRSSLSRGEAMATRSLPERVSALE